MKNLIPGVGFLNQSIVLSEGDMSYTASTTAFKVSLVKTEQFLKFLNETVLEESTSIDFQLYS